MKKEAKQAVQILLTIALFLMLTSCIHPLDKGVQVVKSQPVIYNIPQQQPATPTPTSAKAKIAYPKLEPNGPKDLMFGITVRDPYRIIEDEKAVSSWVEAENNLFLDYLKTAPSGFEKRLEEIMNIGWISDIKAGGGKLFYIKREGTGEQGVLFAREGNSEKELFDPAKIDATGKTALDWYFPSPDGKLVAYGISKDGSEDSTLYLMKTETGEKLADTIPETRACSLVWLKDNAGFYYVRYPKGDQYNRMPYFHKLGNAYEKDEQLPLKKTDKTFWTDLDISYDERFVIIAEHKGWTATDIYLFDREKKTVRAVIKDVPALSRAYVIRDGKLYMHSDLKTPNGRVVIVDPSNPVPEKWKTLIEEDAWPIEWVSFSADRIYVGKTVDISSAIYVYDFSGKKLGKLPLPGIGMIDSFSSERQSDNAAFVFSSLLIPSMAFSVSPAAIETTPVVQIKFDINPDDYEVKQIKYPSYDGEFINMFIVHKKGLKLDGSNQTLLYGYGGFSVTMSPYFSRRGYFWVERGGIYALANIRGGAELGEEWHHAGMLKNKHQVFRDFEYAMRYLISEGYTSPQKLAIEGGSNGGLLMGAMMTECPYLFAVSAGDVGLYDMIRYTRFPPAELWVPEYGSPHKKEEMRFLWGYSPYHQVVDGVKYPAFLAMTAESDTRVHWVHSAKFVARLQEATAGKAPIFFYLEKKAGHGQGKNQSDIILEYVRKFKFYMSIIGDPAKK